MLAVATSTDEEKINQIYQIFQRKARKFGVNLSLPENTDPHKTYSWRYLINFANKMESLGITEEHFPVIIDALLAHARSKKLLNRGFAILIKSEVVELIIKKFEKEIAKDNQKFEEIRNSQQFLMKQGNTQEILFQRKNAGAYTNMTRWYQQGYLCTNFLVLSRNCRTVLNKLDVTERRLFPEPIKLMRLRLQLLSNNGFVVKLQEILGEDLFRE